MQEKKKKLYGVQKAWEVEQGPGPGVGRVLTADSKFFSWMEEEEAA